MEETFFFALLRISVAQILKASGFDKCKPLVLNIITELYIKHLELLIKKTKKFSLARTSATNDIEASDVAEALLNIGFVKPTVPTDPQDKKNTRSLSSFKNWVQYSDSYAVSKKLSAVPLLHLANLIEKRKIDTSSETDQERKKRRLRERQEYFNQLKQGDDPGKTNKASEFPEDLDEDELTAHDKLSWLAYLAEKDMKLGQNMKFVNTCIQDDLMHVHKLKKFHPTLVDGEDSYILFKNQLHNSNKNDHLLLLLHEDEKAQCDKAQPHILPSADLKSILPYNVRYHECLIDDDLQQYLQYASTHKDEINERILALQNPQPTEDVDETPGKGDNQSVSDSIECSAEAAEKKSPAPEGVEGSNAAEETGKVQAGSSENSEQDGNNESVPQLPADVAVPDIDAEQSPPLDEQSDLGQIKPDASPSVEKKKKKEKGESVGEAQDDDMEESGETSQ